MGEIRSGRSSSSSMTTPRWPSMYGAFSLGNGRGDARSVSPLPRRLADEADRGGSGVLRKKGSGVLRKNRGRGDGGTRGVFGVVEDGSRSSRSSTTVDAREELRRCDRRRRLFAAVNGGGGASSPPLVCSPSVWLLMRLPSRLSIIRRAAIRSPPATVLFLVSFDGVGDAEEINARSMGSPVSFDMAIARAAPALLDRKSPAPTLFWMSSSEGRGVDGLVPG